jgi:uracil phosphoribosyltransferase
VTLIEHSLARHKLTLMRERSRDKFAVREKFRRLLHEVGLIMCCEVTRELHMRITDYSADGDGLEIFQDKILEEHRIVIVPIIRGGLELAASFSELLPMAIVGHVGLFREYISGDSKVTNFFTSIPSAPETEFLLIDAEINTSRTISSAVEILMGIGVPAGRISVISLIACESGILNFYQNSNSRFQEVKIFTLAIDGGLDKEGIVYPGVGNVGVRLFGTYRS